MSIERLKQELIGVLRLAKGVCDKADAEGRDLNRAERAEVQKHLARAEDLKAQIKAAEGPAERKAREKAADDALRAAILELVGGEEHSVKGDGTGFVEAGLWSAPFAKAGPWGEAFAKTLGRRWAPESKALIEPTGAVGVPGIVSGLTPLGDKVETILQLVPWTPLRGTDAFSYLREVARVHAAATVAPGQRKPTSTYTVERVDDRARVIAHLSEPIPRTYLDDIALLRQYVDGALREGYQLELEQQILQGDGGGENFTGLLSTSGIQLQPFDTDPLTTARKAITLLELVSITPGAFVFHPQDWEAFELIITRDGDYALRDSTNVVPIDRARRRLWGVPVALSLGQPQGTGLLVDWQGSTQGWEREQVRVDWSESFHVPPDAYDEEGSSGFERNLVQFRCEGRAGFACKRPQGVIEIELQTGS